MIEVAREEWLQSMINLHQEWLADPTNGFRGSFGGLELIDVDLSNLDLRNANFQITSMLRVDFSNSDLSGANFSSCGLRQCNFTNSILDGTNFDHANLMDSHFNTNVDKATFVNAYTKGTVFANTSAKDD